MPYLNSFSPEKAQVIKVQVLGQTILAAMSMFDFSHYMWEIVQTHRNWGFSGYGSDSGPVDYLPPAFNAMVDILPQDEYFFSLGFLTNKKSKKEIAQ